MKSAGKARSNGLYRHIRTSKEIIRNLLNDFIKKEKDAVKAILQEFNPILRDIYCQTKDGNGQRWLMIDLEDKENMYSDIFRLIDIRRG